MKEEIEKTLRPLVGKPLSDMWRYAGLQKFEFGVQRPHKNRKGQDVTWADWGLVVACAWRITGRARPVVASADFGPGRSRHDEQALPFYTGLATAPPIVEAIEAAANGSLRISLSHEYLLEVHTDGETDSEQWRFMPRDRRRRHFVVVGENIQ